MKFDGDIEVRVLSGGQEVDRVVRPLRITDKGPAVKYRQQLWPVDNASISIDGLALEQFIPENPRPPAGEPANVNTEDDGLQESVINAPPELRLMVDAGPGTGKTYVACHRVAQLVRGGMSPSRIWIVSFTRTAVHEIRSRLAAALDDPSQAVAVRIATLDSHAWAIQSGFSRDAALTGSFDDNIAATLSQIRTDEDVQEYLERVGHLIVDEAQDIVGIRAELVEALIKGVEPECGVTVFADGAQSIYGFTEDDTEGVEDGPSLLERLQTLDFAETSLKRVHRTEREELLHIFTNVRNTVLDTQKSAGERGASVREQILKFADGDIGPARKLVLSEIPSGALVLMRQRADVLLASSYGQETPHRLRMSGLPARILPWVGELLWDHADRLLVRGDFDERWLTNVNSVPAEFAEGAWSLLIEAAGHSDEVVDVHRLRNLLGRTSPPSLFTSPDYGDEGPILGTIHASKGREADDVHLYLPPEDFEDGDEGDEEVRVMFVGATRARKHLSIGATGTPRSRHHEGRVWKRLPRNRVQVEVGRTFDLDAQGLVGTSAFGTAQGALEAQMRLRQNPIVRNLFAAANPDLKWRMTLQDKDEKRLCVLSERLKSDLREISIRCEQSTPPTYLPHIRSMGLRSIVLRQDDPTLSYLHEPWASSGFMIAPMLAGFSMTRFRSAR